MKRIVLFLATNLAVVVLLSIIVNVFGLNNWMTARGIDVTGLLVLSAVIGFAGSIFSLLISKPIAKWSTGAEIIDGTEGSTQYWLIETVRKLAERAGIGMPEVAIYEGEPNAFATGAFRNSALVAVSSGLLQSMSREEIEAVLGHEIGHVANGDMVTLTLIQGVVNTFVVFLSRVIGYVVDRAVFKTERGIGPGFYITVIVTQILLGILASLIVAWFSRRQACSARRDRWSPRLRVSAACKRASCRSRSSLRESPVPPASSLCSRRTRRSKRASPRYKRAPDSLLTRPGRETLGRRWARNETICASP